MPLFGTKLSDIESRLYENAEKNRAAFPEEIQQIETGLARVLGFALFSKAYATSLPESQYFILVFEV